MLRLKVITMENKKIDDIKKLAHSINKSLNIFEGYIPKKTDDKIGEALFWREIVNVYGIFSDCDRTQIKERENLFNLFLEFSLIDAEKKGTVFRFYKDISDLRGWFCHNNNIDLYFPEQKKNSITKLINNVFSLSSNKPNSLEDISEKDWQIMNFCIHARFTEYLDILFEALQNWKNSPNKEIIDQQWCIIFSRALYRDQELINNVLAELYKYQLVDKGKRIENISGGVAYFKQILTDGEYSEEDILLVVKQINEKSISSNVIIIQSLERFQLEL